MSFGSRNTFLIHGVILMQIIIILLTVELRRRLLLLMVILLLSIFLKLIRTSLFCVCDQVRILKDQNILTKTYFPNWFQELFAMKDIVPWTYVIDDLHSNFVRQYFLRRTVAKNKMCLRQGKMSRGKQRTNTTFAQFIAYDDLFYSWIDNTHVV